MLFTFSPVIGFDIRYESGLSDPAPYNKHFFQAHHQQHLKVLLINYFPPFGGGKIIYLYIRLTRSTLTLTKNPLIHHSFFVFLAV